MEQLNIVGKRSGEGFVAHKATMVNALSRCLAERLLLMDFTIGRKGLLGYIKALNGSNIVKIVPSTNGSASEVRASDKRLRVVCGAYTSCLDDMAWIGDRTPLTLAEVRISPDNKVKPNIGSLELAEAISRTLPFTATDEKRHVLQCVMFEAGEGKLKLVSSDGYRLAMVTLDYDEGIEAKVLINRDELKGIASALRKAKRVNLSFEKAGETLESMALIIDTEVTRYKFVSADGQFPDYEKVIPTEFSCQVQLDTVEAIKAVYALKATSENPKDYQLDLTIGDGQMVMANPDEKGQTIVKADSDSEASIRLDGRYFADVLRAFGGMVDFSLSKPYSPTLFSNDGFQVVLMPVMSNRANEQQRADKEAKEAEATAEGEPTSEVEAEVTASTEAETKPKRSRSRKREKVAVA